MIKRLIAWWKKRQNSLAQGRRASPGMVAYIEGKDVTDNPHPIDSEDYQYWQAGFMFAEMKYQERADKKALKLAKKLEKLQKVLR